MTLSLYPGRGILLSYPIQKSPVDLGGKPPSKSSLDRCGSEIIRESTSLPLLVRAARSFEVFQIMAERKESKVSASIKEIFLVPDTRPHYANVLYAPLHL